MSSKFNIFEQRKAIKNVYFTTESSISFLFLKAYFFIIILLPDFNVFGD